MADFSFLQDPISHKWISLSPRRVKRPNASEVAEKETVKVCPFCPGREEEEPSVFVILNSFQDPKQAGDEMPKQVRHDNEGDWQVRVITNKFPFAPHHEVIIHTPEHEKRLGDLPVKHLEYIFQTFRQRYNTHKESGHVYIFNNSGGQAGESIDHSHSQLVVVPPEVALETLEWHISNDFMVDAGKFFIGCPDVSQWPDEVWFIPKVTGNTFGDISDEEIASLSDALMHVITMYDHRYGHDFPFNFYIRPGVDWYLRLIPRVKTLGGFEVGTGVFVNTQDPKETIAFIKEHYENPDFEKIKQEHQADYKRHV